MELIERLREAAAVQVAAGRVGRAVELRGYADELERRAEDDPRVAGVLVAAARRRGKRGGRGAGGLTEGEKFMPGALPLGPRKKVPAEVAAIYDAAGSAIVNNALARLRGTFAEELDRAKETVKTAIQHQFGADGVTRYLPFIGEWAESILANLFEHGYDEMKKSHSSTAFTASVAPQTAPQAPPATDPPPAPPAPGTGAPAVTVAAPTDIFGYRTPLSRLERLVSEKVQFQIRGYLDEVGRLAGNSGTAAKVLAILRDADRKAGELASVVDKAVIAIDSVGK